MYPTFITKVRLILSGMENTFNAFHIFITKYEIRTQEQTLKRSGIEPYCIAER